MRSERTKKIVFTALMVALQVVLERVLAINTATVKIGFGFLPLVITAILYGPAYAAVGGALADIIGALVFPAGAYFPGFTVTAALVGMVYGLYLYKLDSREKKPAVIRSFLAVLTVAVAFTLVINTLMISIVYNRGVVALLPSRLIQAGEMIVVQTIVIPIIAKKLCPVIRRI